jgi:UDP-N-acetylmuramate dehydrogenase
MSNDLTPTLAELTSLNTFGLISQTDAYVRLTSVAQLPALSILAKRYSQCLVLGGASNVILPERVPGLVVHMQIKGVRLLESRPDGWIIEAAGGENWHEFVQTCLHRGWDGLENLALIPGTVGAAPVQNIGAYGLELQQRFLGLSAWDRLTDTVVQMSAQDCRFGYRDSRFKHDAPGRWVILAVQFCLPRPWQPLLSYLGLRPYLESVQAAGAVTAQSIFEAVCALRRDKLPDPALIGNVGSFFKNPIVNATTHHALRACYPGLVSYRQREGGYKLAAAWLIEQAGWKGRTLGRVGVHPHQALVLVNEGGACAKDILHLANLIRQDVQARFDIELEQEPILV